MARTTKRIRKRRVARELPVVDAKGLAEVAEVVFGLRPDLIPQATMWRMRNGKAAAIRQSTFDALRDVLAAQKSREASAMLTQLFQAALGADGLEISDCYREWLTRQRDQFFNARMPYVVPRKNGRGIRRVTAQEFDNRRVVAKDAIGGELRGVAILRLRDFNELIIALQDTHIGDLLDDFEVWIAATGHGDPSDNSALYSAAYHRILGPLLESPRSGYVERHWREFSLEEMSQFVAAGIRREKILLNRAPESRRIQAVLAGELPPTR